MAISATRRFFCVRGTITSTSSNSRLYRLPTARPLFLSLRNPLDAWHVVPRHDFLARDVDGHDAQIHPYHAMSDVIARVNLCGNAIAQAAVGVHYRLVSNSPFTTGFEVTIAGKGNASRFRVDTSCHGPYPSDHGGQISESRAQARGAETVKGGRRKAAEEQGRQRQASSED